MTYTPIPHGTPDWDVPVNAAFTDQDGRIDAAQGDADTALATATALAPVVNQHTADIDAAELNIAANSMAITSLQTRTNGEQYFLLVAANDSATVVKNKADYVCDGVADDVQIQAALDAAKSQGGGIVQLSEGTFNLAAQLNITGNTDEDNADGVVLLGCGQQATFLKPVPDINGIHLTNWAVASIEKLAIICAGTGSCLTSTAVLSGNEVSFWHSSFRDLRLNGYLGVGSTTGWGMDLAMPWRSTFENIEIEGMANGMRLSNQGTVQNAGDCTFTRMFIEIVGNNHTGIHISSPSNNMNQNNFNMVELGANGAGCTGILIDGASGGASQRFWGLNAEQFQITVSVENGESNVFDCNYVTGDTGQPGNVIFRCGANAYNNTFSAKWVNIPAGETVGVINDTNNTSNAPNIFERIRLEVNSGGSVTYTKTNSTVFRDITTFNDGGTIQAGLLQYPLSKVNDPDWTAPDQNLLTWTQDPVTVSQSFSLANGQVYLSKLKIVNRSTVVSNISYGVTVAGTTPTAGQCFVGLYNSSGTLLASSADQGTNFSSTGTKTAAITPQTLAVGSYYVAFLSNVGGTVPQVASGGSGTVSSANLGLTAGTARSLTTGASNTTLPASITLSAQSLNPALRWAALS